MLLRLLCVSSTPQQAKCMYLCRLSIHGYTVSRYFAFDIVSCGLLSCSLSETFVAVVNVCITSFDWSVCLYGSPPKPPQSSTQQRFSAWRRRRSSNSKPRLLISYQWNVLGLAQLQMNHGKQYAFNILFMQGQAIFLDKLWDTVAQYVKDEGIKPASTLRVRFWTRT